MRSLLAVLLVVSVAFFLSAGQSAIVGPNNTAAPETFEQFIGLLGINLLGLPQLWTGSLGTWSLGWFDTSLPAIVPTLTGFVFAGLAFWGLRRLYWRKSVAVGLVALSLVVVPLYILMHDQVIVGAYVQPRYFLPLLSRGICHLLHELNLWNANGCRRTGLFIVGGSWPGDGERQVAHRLQDFGCRGLLRRSMPSEFATDRRLVAFGSRIEQPRRLIERGEIRPRIGDLGFISGNR